MNRLRPGFAAIFTAAIGFLLSAPAAHSGQDSDNNPAGGLNVSVGLKHRVVIPQIVYFRIGSGIFNSVDKVTFDLAQSAGFNTGTNSYNGSNPLGNNNPASASSNGDLQVDLRSNVGSITLSYQVSNSSGLENGSGQFIDYDEITTSNVGQISPPSLNNAATGASLVNGNLFGGRVVKLQDVWTYAYKNTTAPAAGTYTGRVTYTASAP